MKTRYVEFRFKLAIPAECSHEGFADQIMRDLKSKLIRNVFSEWFKKVGPIVDLYAIIIPDSMAAEFGEQPKFVKSP